MQMGDVLLIQIQRINNLFRRVNMSDYSQFLIINFNPPQIQILQVPTQLLTILPPFIQFLQHYHPLSAYPEFQHKKVPEAVTNLPRECIGRPCKKKWKIKTWNGQLSLKIFISSVNNRRQNKQVKVSLETNISLISCTLSKWPTKLPINPWLNKYILEAFFQFRYSWGELVLNLYFIQQIYEPSTFLYIILKNSNNKQFYCSSAVYFRGQATGLKYQLKASQPVYPLNIYFFSLSFISLISIRYGWKMCLSGRLLFFTWAGFQVRRCQEQSLRQFSIRLIGRLRFLPFLYLSINKFNQNQYRINKTLAKALAGNMDGKVRHS